MLPFKKVPDLITDKELITLYYKLTDCSSYNSHVQEWAKQLIIKGNIAQALYICKLRARAFKSIPPDYIGCAMLRLVECVEAIKNGAIANHSVPNVRGYITVALQGCLRDHVITDRLFWVDRKTYKKIEASGQTFAGMATMADIEKPTKGDLSEMIANQELLRLTVFSEFEKEVVEARLRGETDPKIAELLNCSKQHVHRTRQRIQERIREKLNDRRMDCKVRGTVEEPASQGHDPSDC